MTNYKDNSSSSSEEDENIKQALREATDQDLFKNSFFSGNKSDEEEKKVDNVSDKLEEKQQSQEFYNFGVSVHFQEFVGKKLTEYLDREIELVEITPKKCKNKTIDGGIKLLNESIDVINCEEEISSIIPKKKKRKLRDRSENNISNSEKCQQAAVDPQFILSKSEVMSWNERQKGTVFNYKKMPDGKLVQCD
ncbi:uncharacterized protein LOC123260384 [Cotesia glomerata]|uniref:Protein CUSTOS n=1 Tax=Cotesia glomerata TaxID=32391 RepID=A0AAV7IHV5_COTGL|nr:uncharacterized protein LOC123260384 [Cotesia glomerata]XP_044577387.1 uncharacterized protein LOC123260384 [Cotesia glomerata]XP_044577388.1 uncharacterized protein LOC123260384 [Cotesia glomerata]XP_044577389.1 uncharacterized protein LOC123260384 [Cotesia glomerata]KAH0550656.1 hypothetical protein KQX54_020442 [Cotesia glomerata]